MDKPDTRILKIRLLLMGLSSLLGLIGVLLTLVIQERLVVLPLSEWGQGVAPILRFQSPPLYLQEPGAEKTGHRYLYDPLLGWRNIPGWEATTFGHPVKINRLGMRSSPIRREKPPGIRRLLVLGDSLMWGFGVSQEDLFTEKLEQLLNAGPDAGPPWEVLNTGVSGWGTDQEWLYLREEGIHFQPDAVLLAFYILNDPADISNPVRYGLNKPMFLDTRLTLGHVPVPKPGETGPPLITQAPALDLCGALFEAMANLCRNQGIPLILMKFGYQPGVAPRLDAFHADWIQRYSRPSHQGWVTLDLDQAFSRLSPEDQARLFEGVSDGHWGPFGHQQAAKEAASMLLSLPKPGPAL